MYALHIALDIHILKTFIVPLKSKLTWNPVFIWDHMHECIWVITQNLLDHCSSLIIRHLVSSLAFLQAIIFTKGRSMKNLILSTPCFVFALFFVNFYLHMFVIHHKHIHLWGIVYIYIYIYLSHTQIYTYTVYMFANSEVTSGRLFRDY